MLLKYNFRRNEEGFQKETSATAAYKCNLTHKYMFSHGCRISILRHFSFDLLLNDAW